MTAEEIDEIIEVLKAFKEGKGIEIEINGEWLDYSLMLPDYKIRTKPQPEYVPFSWEDRELFRGRWVRWKHEDKEFTIDCIEERGLCFSGELFTWERLFTDLEFIDGSIFGKLKQ